MPAKGATVAAPPMLLLHEPPVDASNNVVGTPKHTMAAPVIGAGNGFTVTVAVEYMLPQGEATE